MPRKTNLKKGTTIAVISHSPKRSAKDSKYIYTVTCLYDLPPYCLKFDSKYEYKKKMKEYESRGGCRCFGWFSSLKQAKEAVEKNHGDIHEYSYLYVVIEKNSDGFRFEIPTEWWYKWNGTHERGGYIPIDKPKEIQQTIGWGMG